MKKSIAIILCLIISLSALLTGCGSDAEKLVGQWKTTVDMSSYINKSMKESDPETAEYFNFTDLSFDMIMTFGENGECSMEVDEDSWSEMAEKLGDQMKDGFDTYFADLLKGMGTDMTADELLSSMGMSMDDLIDGMVEMLVSDDVIDAMETEGYFQLKDGMLFIADESDEAFDEEAANPYKLSGKKLTLQVSEEGEDEEYSELLFPMVLEKVK